VIPVCVRIKTDGLHYELKVSVVVHEWNTRQISLANCPPSNSQRERGVLGVPLLSSRM